MVGGGGGWLGKINEIEEIGEKNKKRGRKREEKGEKGIFLGYKLQKFPQGVFRPPLHHPAAYLFVGKTGEKALKMHLFGS